MAHQNNFETVMTCESNPEYAWTAAKKLDGNVFVFLQDSSKFLREYVQNHRSVGKSGIPFFYLDAHFYNPKGPRWVVKNELEALAGFNNCVIAIHDFNNGELGHCVYDGEPLGLNVVGDGLRKVNPDFHLYTNTKKSCRILRPDEVSDPDAIDNLRYANSCDRLKYRGILYALPDKMPQERAIRLGLRRIF